MPATLWGAKDLQSTPPRAPADRGWKEGQEETKQKEEWKAVSRSVMAAIIYLFMYFLLKRDVGLMSKEPGGLLVGGAGVMGHKPQTLGPEAPLQSGGSLGGKCSSAAGKALPRPCVVPDRSESARADAAPLTLSGFSPQHRAGWSLRRRLCISGAAWLPGLRPAVHLPTVSSLAPRRSNSSAVLWQVQPRPQAGSHSASASAFGPEQAWDPSLPV